MRNLAQASIQTSGALCRAAGCINSLRIVFLTLHQVSSLHQVSATCTHAHDAGALSGFGLKVTWWRYSIFDFSVCTTSVKRYGRKVADGTLSDIFFKIKADGSVSIALRYTFSHKRARHRGPRGPRWRPRPRCRKLSDTEVVRQNPT